MNTYLLIVLTTLYFGVPSYISWRYDVDILLRDKQFIRKDMKRQVFWYFWIPIIGRFLLHQRDIEIEEGLDREFIISLVENTGFYFVVGVIGNIPAGVSFTVFLGILWWVMMIIIPIEYLLTLKYPKWFMSDGDIDYVEYVNVFYHAFWFSVLGYLVGGLFL